MRKRVLVSILAACVAVGISACGGKSKAAPTTTAAPATTAAPETTAAPTTTAAPETEAETEAEEDYIQIPVTVVNGTGVDIAALRLSGASLDEWGDDLLDGEIMTHGTYAELLLNVDEDNLAWDMQVEDTDGNSLEWYDIDISDMPSDGFVIELLWDGSEGTANLLEDMTQLEGDYSAVQ